MRPRKYILTPEEVEDCAATILQDAVRLPDRGRKCAASTVWCVLLYAAARITSIADACARLRNAPCDDAVRAAIRRGLPDVDELERRLNDGLLDLLPRRLLRRRKHRVAIDLTLIPYHGQPHRDKSEVYRGEAKSGTTHFHAYATCYMVHRGQRFTLALARVTLGAKLEEVVARLLRRVRAGGVEPRLVLLDRGFYSVGVVRYLQASRTPFLMPVQLRGRKPNDPRGPTATNVFAAWKKSGWSTYSWTNADGRRATVDICVAVTRKGRRSRGKGRRATLVYAYWGCRPSDFGWVRRTYRLRFGIETSYRQLHQARIRTTTRDPLQRLLFVGTALVLRNVWVWLHLMVLAEPAKGRRVQQPMKLTFRTILAWLMHRVESIFGLDERADAYVPSRL